MYTILLITHVLVCIALVISVLLQSSKGGGLGGAFGGGASDTLFGGQGASSFLKKVTQILAITFMVMSVLLALSITPQKTVKSSGISEEIDKMTEESPEKKAPSSLPEGFEVLPEPEDE